MPEGFTLADALFEAASAQGTVGLSTGITDPTMSPVIEIVYIINMWAGRLEILPLLVLGRALVWGTKPWIE
jgi:trk system potassium uptake protein TrkH